MRRKRAWLAAVLFAGGCTATHGPTPDGAPSPPLPAEAPSASAPAAPAPSPGKAPRKVYTVAEVENLVDSDPRAVLNTTLNVRAQVVGGVNGDECSDFLVLTDPDSVAAYQKLFDPTASNAEFEHARAVPLVLAGPSRSFPTEILEMNAAVFTGRFVTCERALRFRIERAVPLEQPIRH